MTFTGQAPQFTNNNTAATAALPLPTFGSAATEADPTNVNVISYSKHDPTSMIQEWNLQFEHQFGNDTVIDLAYVGAKADHETNTYSYSSPQLVTGDRFFGTQGLGVTVNTNNGTFHYNGLQARFNHNMSHGLQTTVAYTWSHALDDATGAYSQTGASTILMTANGPLFSANKGNADNDQRQAVTVSILYELPFGRGRQFGTQMSRGLDYIVGGWQLNPFWNAGSGTPYNLTVNPVNTSGPSDRPDIIADPENGRTSRASTGYIQWFNPSAFTRPAMTANNIYTRPGTLARNTFAGPGYDTLTASLFKNIPIWNRVVTQLRFEGYNLLNHPQFTNPDSSYTDADFGQINSTRQHSERELQGAIRVTF